MFPDHKFTALQLDIINKQAELYNCVGPIHVSMKIINLRKLFDYQKTCMDMPTESDAQMQVHKLIAEVTRQSHQLMEQCLDEVLDLEGWDKTTLQMPVGIRTRLRKN